MSNPVISIIICTYNRAHSLSIIIDNLKSQILKGNAFPWEVVFVDNNSTDATRKLIEQHKNEGYITIQYVFEPKQGKSYALNSGVRSARGELLAFTDDDVILDSHWLQSVYDAFHKYPYSCFGGRVLPIIKGAMPPWLEEGYKRYRVYGGPVVTHDRGDVPRLYDEIMYVPIGSNMFVRRVLFDRYGSFNTRLGFYSKESLIYGEDVDIMFRFRRGGEQIYYYPTALVYHPIIAERMTKAYFRKWFWGLGRGEARRAEIGPSAVRYCNIPRSLIRQSFTEFLRFSITFLKPNKYASFYHEMQLIHKLAMMHEFYIEED